MSMGCITDKVSVPNPDEIVQIFVRKNKENMANRENAADIEKPKIVELV